MKAENVMTCPAVCVRAEASILDAAQLMLQNKISGLPVVDDDGKLVGIVTERDFLRSGGTDKDTSRPRWLQLLTGEKRLAGEIQRLQRVKVAKVMTPEPASVNENTPLEGVAHLMGRHDIKRVPVVRGGKVVGIIARADLVRALVRAARKAANSTVQVTARITELERQALTRQGTPR